MRNVRGDTTLFDWIAYLVGIGILLLIGYAVFYPTFEEWYTKLWEEIDRIREKLRSDKHD